MTKSAKFCATVMAAVALLIAALPVTASASSTSVSVHTSDAHPGGAAYLKRAGVVRDPTSKRVLAIRYTLTASDIQADGYGVRAYASYYHQQQNKVRDSGGLGTSRSGTVTAAPGKTVYVQVCLANPTAGQHFCSAWDSIVAR
jgi:hypothetical protein